MGLSPYRTQGWQKRFHYPKALPAYVTVFTACHIIDYSLRPNMNEQVQANKQGVWSLTHMLIHLHCLKKRKRKRVKVINFFEKEKPSGSHLNKTGGFCKCLWQTVLKASCVPPGNYLHLKKKKKNPRLSSLDRCLLSYLVKCRLLLRSHPRTETWLHGVRIIWKQHNYSQSHCNTTVGWGRDVVGCGTSWWQCGNSPAKNGPQGIWLN